MLLAINSHNQTIIFNFLNKNNKRKILPIQIGELQKDLKRNY